jgi:hypothetical protein
MDGLRSQWNLLAAVCVYEGVQSSASSIRPGTYVGAYFALWALAFMSLRFFEGFEASEALAALVVLGVIFPALAMLATRRVSALPCVVRRPGVETAVLVMYLLVVIAWVLVSVLDRVAHIRTEPLHFGRAAGREARDSCRLSRGDHAGVGPLQDC